MFANGHFQFIPEQHVSDSINVLTGHVFSDRSHGNLYLPVFSTCTLKAVLICTPLPTYSMVCNFYQNVNQLTISLTVRVSLGKKMSANHSVISTLT